MLRFLSGGESHGPGLCGMLEGVPAGLAVARADIDRELRRRQLGYGRGARQAIEGDSVEVLSGIRQGQTLGSPIVLLVRNRDHANWLDRMGVDEPGVRPSAVVEARPGHADFSGMLKYGTDDLRDILERSSARHTATHVAVGAICKMLLGECGIFVAGHVVRLGGVSCSSRVPRGYEELRDLAEASCLRMIDPDAERAAVALVDSCGTAGDTVGGVFEVVVYGCPPGLGSHVHWDRRLDSRLAGALMGIQAIKGVEVGLGFGVADRRGSEVHDEMLPGVGGVVRPSNNAGGLEGGMTNGEPVVVRAAMKPISTLKKPLRSVNMATGEGASAHFERSDVCAVPAASVIGEAMVALVVAGALVEKFGGDSMRELQRNLGAYRSEVASRLAVMG